MSKQNPIIALAGNPNVGKTTLFNALTSSRQTVGNWPGVTVEHKQGYYLYQGKRYEVIDLPGIYSLSANSPDEQAARHYILQKSPDLVINIVDASNLERNLYLSVQLMELGLPMLMVLSMTDIAAMNGIGIELEHLISHLGFEVMPLILNKRFDGNDLLERIEANLQNPTLPAKISYDEVVEIHLNQIISALEGETLDRELLDKVFVPRSGISPDSAEDMISPLHKRWLALKLVEEDPEIGIHIPENMTELVQKEIRSIAKHRGQASGAVIADDRYGFIRGLVKDVVKRQGTHTYTFSDRIDKLALSGIWGMPIFFGVMYLVFLLAVRFSEPLIGWIDRGLSWIFVEQMGALLRQTIIPEWLVYLFSDALGGGIATIGTFIPPIFFIFVSLSILEDSGYMARAAFIADKFMRRIGLPGKAFIPLLVGFGCTVPAIMATRTLESKRDRVFASLLTPFMSCGAKLPVYTFLAMMFFPRRADIVVFGLYLFGVVMAMVFGLLLKKTIFKTQPGNFVMELPPYHFPTFNAILLHTWHRLKDFILRAGKTILIVIMAVTILQGIYIPNPLKDGQKNINVLELGGKIITPLLQPMGIKADNWQASVALISGVFAKEAIVGTLQGLYQEEGSGGAEGSPQDNMRSSFGGIPSVLAYLVFVLLYAPCAATLAMLLKEHGWRWMSFAFGYLTVFAWILATLVYQILSFSSQSFIWLGFCLLLGSGFYLSLKYFGIKEHHHVLKS
ncbi:MAG: ferrous iron transport protein B [Candidatus Cloacimonadaceae bacterium]|nr:ferrous iron transport protein B [Candidatus Cloacimonadaceae bacterium]MDP3115164.1 ferrous iron transport protein B [Candidatus Cloacimonadaceae bacterium]